MHDKIFGASSIVREEEKTDYFCAQSFRSVLKLRSPRKVKVYSRIQNAVLNLDVVKIDKIAQNDRSQISLLK